MNRVPRVFYPRIRVFSSCFSLFVVAPLSMGQERGRAARRIGYSMARAMGKGGWCRGRIVPLTRDGFLSLGIRGVLLGWNVFSRAGEALLGSEGRRVGRLPRCVFSFPTTTTVVYSTFLGQLKMSPKHSYRVMTRSPLTTACINGVQPALFFAVSRAPPA